MWNSWISFTGRQYPELKMVFFPSGDGYALEDGLLCAFLKKKKKSPSSAIEGESPRSSAICRFVEKYGACSGC